MKVSLLRLDGLDVAMLGASCCVSEKIPAEPNPKALLKACAAGHLSTLEHAVVSFAIENVSRVTEIQLVRHRLASYSIRSGRYVNLSDCSCIVPESVEEWDEAGMFFREAVDSVALYNTLTDCGIKGEDARYILPQGMATNLVMTMNLREFSHACQLRRCARAQKEIREMFDSMARLVKTELVAQGLGELGPLFERQCHYLGYCPEAKGCGYMPPLQKILDAYGKVKE